MKFREWRAGDSVAPVVHIRNRADLLTHCRALLSPFSYHFKDDAFRIQRYIVCPTLEWERQSLVTIDGYGVIGITDSLPDPDKAEA